MAIRSNENQKQQTEVNNGPVCCRQCVHAHLIQYSNNPVIAECFKKPQEGNTRFPYAVDVASTMKNCKMFGRRNGAEEIEHRPLNYWKLREGELAA